ncbi:MAG: ATP-binding protein [Patescibacteria group bacterium]
MYIHRSIEKTLTKTLSKFPILGLVGPRQSGKTTLLKKLFPKFSYANMEDIELREYAQTDPKGFLETHQSPLIVDEAQRVPKLFSQLQVLVDEKKKMGSYILSGSQNFLLMEQISQSLAGRISTQTLLPMSYQEISRAKLPVRQYSDFIFKGQYPRMYQKPILESHEFYNSYLSTYVERDLRQLINVSDLATFQRFLKLCAGRVGQEINLSSLAQDAGITHNTAKSWLSVLETSFIIFQLQPFYKNYNKRLVKSSKLYFHDTGLATWLLSIDEKKQVQSHFAIGGLFENMIISEYLKNQYNQGKRPKSYFWRDQQRKEIDLIIDGTVPIGVEIKKGKTISSDYFKNLSYWNNLSKSKPQLKVIYGGESSQNRSDIQVLPWSRMNEAWS